jgi:Fanconi-associated nuclease 1
MVGQRIKHPKSTNFDAEDESSPRHSKRVKREQSDDTLDETTAVPNRSSPTKRTARVVPDSDAESDDEKITTEEGRRKTNLEDAVPLILNEQEAIEAYEATRAAEAEEREGGMEGTTESRLNERKWVRGRSSIYVDAFNLALETVLEEEMHLFDEAERKLFEVWRGLGYEAQYLYVRLFLRKTSAWHRINSLGYHGDIADLDAAIEELQQVRELPKSEGEPENHPGELEPPPGTTLESEFTFADKSDLITTLEEASSLLKLTELKVIAKEAKVQGKNKKELLQALRRSSKQQTGILRRSDTNGSIRSEGGESPQYDKSERSRSISRPGTPSGDDERNRDTHFTRKIMNETGPCVRLSLAPLKLFQRVHLVFYRSTEWTEKSLTTIILARIARWNFPDYIVSRSASVFGSRALLVEFEASLRTQNRVDNILEFNGRPTPEGYQTIIDIYTEVYPRWRALLAEEQQKEDHVYQSGEGAYLRRLSPAWVYTRLMHKAADVLGKMKRHKEEHQLLVELLEQRLFHHARRGAWYQRRALLEEHYMHALTPSDKRDEESQKRHWKKIALTTCEDGLQDSLVHLIYQYDLQKRIVKIEKSLKIAKRLQHDFSHVRLTAPVEVTIKGTQVIRDTPPVHPTAPGRPKAPMRSTKTIWLDPLEDNGECSVEAMCLSHYRSQGYRGYHSEGGIVRTLFAYLFFDVLFTYVPNVFQTSFQQCPLDLHTDAFYPTRLSEITRRLNDIANGDATLLIKQIYDAHHVKQTCVVGLDWSYDIDDLLEIAEFFDGDALSTICKVMAQEYSVRGGGVPDLFLWHPEKREVRFAEVKSENDRLSDTQRLWIHVLTGAGVKVDLALAVAEEVRVVPV